MAPRCQVPVLMALLGLEHGHSFVLLRAAPHRCFLFLPTQAVCVWGEYYR